MKKLRAMQKIITKQVDEHMKLVIKNIENILKINQERLETKAKEYEVLIKNAVSEEVSKQLKAQMS